MLSSSRPSGLDYVNSLQVVGMSSVNVEKLQRIQNTLTRVVFLTKKKNYISKSSFGASGPPSRRLQVRLLSYKIRQSGEPELLGELLTEYVPTRKISYAERNYLVMPWTILVAASRTFSVAELRNSNTTI